MLIIDEADCIMQVGFEEEMMRILKLLPKNRQTILYSATQTKKVEDLCKLSLRDPVIVDVSHQATHATVQNLEQGYVVVDADKKFRLLFTFL